MSHPQKPYVFNGLGRRKIDKDAVCRTDNLNWRHSVRTSSNSPSQGGNKVLHERLLYMYTCLIGQHVEVQKIDGHVYSGIFHAAIMDKESGVILKMARLMKNDEQALQGGSVREAARKPPIRTYVIQGNDFVQIIAKDVSLSGDAASNVRAQENRSDILTDELLSQGWHRESERELKPWKADDESSEDISLNLSNTWRRNMGYNLPICIFVSYDAITLIFSKLGPIRGEQSSFGVETTFDEELYTTKLIRGPQMREREREAQRIAREIVGQQTRNTHLAEERGVHLSPELEVMDEETKYSSVGRGYQDVGDDDEDQHMDDLNDETFGGSAVLVCTNNFQNSSLSTPISGQSDGQESSMQSADPEIVGDVLRRNILFEHQDLSLDKAEGGGPDCFSESYKDPLRLRKLLVGEKTTNYNKGSGSSYSSPLGRCSPLLSPSVGDPAGINALNLDPSCPQVPDDVYREFKEFKQQKQLEALKALSESFKKDLEPRSPRAAELVVHPTISPSSSTAPLPAFSTSKKSPLNIHAKEFKLNPNAKAFTPSSNLIRPTTVVAQHPVVAQSTVLMQSAIPAATTIQGSHVTVAQQNYYSQYNHAGAAAVVAVNPTPYVQSPGVSVPGFPVGGVGGGGILPGQPNMRMSPHSQQQALSAYVLPHQVKYPPPTSPLQAGFSQPNGQLFSQHMMFGQPANPVVFMPYPQGIMQGYAVPTLGQGHLCSQPHQSQPRNRRQGDMSA